MTAEVKYTGELRTVCVHLKSSTEIVTDAPTDNQGKGQSFSPTDLLATSLAACMLTIMDIRAQKMSISIAGTKALVTKVMASNPRRVEKVKVELTMPANSYSPREKEILIKAAETCPVA